MNASPLRFAVLLSGSGRTLENFLRLIESGELPAQLVAVASNKPGVRGLEIAEGAGLPAKVFARAEYPDRKARDAAMFAWLQSYDPELFCLAGYLSLLELDGAGGKPVLNIHPSLLPKFGGKGFYGERVHRAVLEAGERSSGATVHLVDAVFDRGPVVAQVEVPVEPGDDSLSLAARVFSAECELYPRVLRELASGERALPGLE